MAPRTDRPTLGAAAAAGLLALFLMVLIVLAATAGPGELLRDRPSEESSPRSPEAGAETPVDEPEDETGTASEDEEPDDGSGLPWAALAGLVTLLVMGFVLYRIVAAARGALARREVVERHADPGFTVAERIDGSDDRAVVRAVAAAADEQMVALLEGTPRNGIVACWHALERAAMSAGAGRDAWETAEEFTVRLLGSLRVDAAAAWELADLFVEARFSDHDLDEAARARARELLAVIHRGLPVAS